MSMRPITQFITSTSTSNAVLVPLEYAGGAFQCSIQVVVSGTGTFEVDGTLDPCNDFVNPLTSTPNDNTNSNGLYTAPVTATTGNWVAVPGLTALTTGVYQSNLAFPCTALRLRCTATGTGYAVIRVVQTAVAQ